MSMYLTNGASSHRSIYLAGRSDSAALASYAYRDGESLKCETGSQKDVMALFVEHKMAGCEEEGGFWKVALMVVIPIVLIVAAVTFAQNAFQVAGVAIFAVIAAFPCYSLSLVGENNLSSDALYQQLRRHHGAEHMVMNYFRKVGEKAQTPISVQDLQGYRYLDRECGTVMMASIVLWAAALGVAVALVPAWGAMGALKLMAAVTVLLLLNTYVNPANPLVNIQKPEVAPPTLAELEVAATAYNALLAAFEGEEQQG